MPKPITRVSYARDDDEQFVTVGINSRDLIALELKYRDITASAMFSDLSFVNLYKLIYVALRRRSVLAQEVTLVPIILTRRVIPKEERLLYTTLCVLARSQE